MAKALIPPCLECGSRPAVCALGNELELRCVCGATAARGAVRSPQDVEALFEEWRKACNREEGAKP